MVELSAYRAEAPSDSVTLPERTRKTPIGGPKTEGIRTYDKAHASRKIYREAWFQRLVVWGGLLVLWQLLAFSVGDYFWPPVQDVGFGFIDQIFGGAIPLVATSFGQMFTGFGLAIVIGIPIGLMLGTSQFLEKLLRPYVNILFVTSLTAIVPVLILTFGTGFEFRVAVVFLFSVFYLIITPADGVRAIESGLLDAARAFGARRIKYFSAVILPATLPFVASGVRLGFGQAVQGMIIAELWITFGTGGRLNALSLNHDLGKFFALVAIVVIVGAVISQILVFAEKKLTSWTGDTAEVLAGAN